MTADTKLLPLPEPFTYVFPDDERTQMFHTKHMEAYARANVERHTELLRAELDRLRGEHARVRRELAASKSRAERLADALAAALEDAERWREAEKHFRIESPDMGGKHRWTWTGHRYRGPSIAAAIDAARKEAAHD